MVRLASDGQSQRFVNLSPHGATRGRIGCIRDMRLRFGGAEESTNLLERDGVKIGTCVVVLPVEVMALKC